MASTTTKTPEQRKAEMEALHGRLGEQVEALRSSHEWTRYLTFCAAFHRYSVSNLLLILAQRQDASQVAGYRAWQKLGRQVRKGERGIAILGTGEKKITADDDETGEQTTTGRRRVFFPVRVFDINQTDPIEGSEPVEHPARHLTGDDQGDILAAVLAHLTAQGVEVSRSTLREGLNGYTTRGDLGLPVTVVISDRLSPAQAAKTALHEAAHVTLGHITDDHAEYLAHRGRYEVEAESVAYVLAGLLGLDTSAYSVGYVATWAEQEQPDTIKDTAVRVLTAVHTLAEALAPTDAHDNTAHDTTGRETHQALAA